MNAGKGGTVTLPIGTQIEITCANGVSVSAIAELGDKLLPIYLFVEQYPMLALAPRS